MADLLDVQITRLSIEDSTLRIKVTANFVDMDGITHMSNLLALTDLGLGVGIVVSPEDGVATFHEVLGDEIADSLINEIVTQIVVLNHLGLTLSDEEEE